MSFFRNSVNLNVKFCWIICTDLCDSLVNKKTTFHLEMLSLSSRKFLKNGDLVLSFKQPQEMIQLTSKLETTLDFDFINYTKKDKTV